MNTYVAVKAVIRNKDGTFLILRDGERWHAPGGRLEQGETLHDGLRREIKEETGILYYTAGDVVYTDEWIARSEDAYMRIVALFFLCKVRSNKVTLSDEHSAYAWVAIDEFSRYRYTLEDETACAILSAHARIS